MRSQKINNRAPRPFKDKTERWSGGRDSKSFIPAPKPAFRAAKKNESPPQAEAPPAGDDQK